VSWRVANSLLVLRAEINRRWPNRDTVSDGTIGDEAHRRSKSDHNPNSKGVVRALDIDVDGINAAWLAEHVRQLGAKGDARLTDGGYAIFNHRIASEVKGWTWRAYDGRNPHTAHVHVSVSRTERGYDSTAAWGVPEGTGPVNDPPIEYEPYRKGVTPGSRQVKLGSAGDDVLHLQRRIGGVGVDGYFGKATEARVRWFQKQRGLGIDGIVGPRTWASVRPTHK
jgi:peptidoglycan hydrolase-like protein with peptidoglycan-binding domain